MNTEQQIELVDNIPNEGTMPRADAVAIYSEFRAKAEELRKTAETISVSDIADTAGMKLARQTRLSLREIRIAVEHRRKDLVEEMTRETRRINAAAKEIRDYCDEHETRLLEIEQFADREAARLEDERRTERAHALRPYLDTNPVVDLGKIGEDEYQKILADAKDLFELRKERERKAEEERIAREKAEAEERERIRKENERLKAEAAERERLAAEERKANEARLAEERRKAEEERRKAEEERRKEREEAEKKLAEERRKAEAARKEAEDKARKERESREKAEAEIRRQKEADARRQAAEEARRREEEAKAAALAAAPDAEKVREFAKLLASLPLPSASTDRGRETFAKIAEQQAKFVAWLENSAAALTHSNH